MTHSEMTPIVLLCIFVPGGLVGALLGTVALVTYHRRAVAIRQQGVDLVRMLLEHATPATEIERVLWAWHGNGRLARQMLKELMPAKEPPEKVAAGW